MFLRIYVQRNVVSYYCAHNHQVDRLQIVNGVDNNHGNIPSTSYPPQGAHSLPSLTAIVFCMLYLSSMLAFNHWFVKLTDSQSVCSCVRSQFRVAHKEPTAYSFHQKLSCIQYEAFIQWLVELTFVYGCSPMVPGPWIVKSRNFIIVVGMI